MSYPLTALKLQFTWIAATVLQIGSLSDVLVAVEAQDGNQDDFPQPCIRPTHGQAAPGFMDASLDFTKALKHQCGHCCLHDIKLSIAGQPMSKYDRPLVTCN
ncbi:hypothetical protein P7K49_014932 [Saguinus oedipus]|uniref:Secreted protein n=1 Tax=Saguinus oedipus TaxID=9490 RepID=A0ABQ9V7S8_SAGOE|nr:hypothetical protein P7K49_014932 [Saguinus oedipus]